MKNEIFAGITLFILILSTSLGSIDNGIITVSAEPGTEIFPGFAAKFGSSGAGDGQFNGPFGVAVNETHIFVADLGNSRVQILDMKGKVLYVNKACKRYGFKKEIS